MISITAVATLALCGCGETAASATQPAPSAPEVGFIVVQEQEVPLSTELPGRTVAVLKAEVRPQVGGILQARKFDEGAEVEQGQVLYEIDPAVHRAALGQATAALASAEASIDSSRLRAERYGDLLKDEAVSQQEADDAQASYHEATAAVAQAKAALTKARLDLSYTKVRAPIAGRIGLSRVTPGSLVSENQAQALTTIRNLDPIYVDFVQSSVDMLRLRKRMVAQGDRPEDAKLELLLEDGSRYPHAGRLLSREVAVDEATGAVTLRAEFDNADEVLLPGMYVRVNMTQGIARGAVLAPQRGVARNTRAEPMAWVIDQDGKAQQRTLQVAQTVDTCWLVTSGLAQGDRLIVEGTQNLSVGVQVTAKETQESAACAPAERTQQADNGIPKANSGSAAPAATTAHSQPAVGEGK